MGSSEFTHQDIYSNGIDEYWNIDNTECYADIEIISIDPEREYVDDEQPDSAHPEVEYSYSDQIHEPAATSYGETDILKFREAFRKHGRKRAHKKSLSVPHSPKHYSFDLSAISLDDLDSITQFDLPQTELLNGSSSSITRDCDLPAYKQQDDNFEVISPPKRVFQEKRRGDTIISPLANVYKVEENSRSNYSRACAKKRERIKVVSKSLTLPVPSKPVAATTAQQQQQNQDESDTELVDDNAKADPTWMPSKKAAKCSKNIDKIKPIKVNKVAEVIPASKVVAKATKKPLDSSTGTKSKSMTQKRSGQSRLLETKAHLTQDKIHKLVSAGSYW